MPPKVKKSEQEWMDELESQRYDVLRRKATESPFSGKYVYTKDKGVYKCGGCGAELFDSETKFDSGTGWPSFTEPMGESTVELVEDRSHGMLRTEVVCAACGGHLGHVFDDGPGPNGKRFCINSCSLDLAAEESD